MNEPDSVHWQLWQDAGEEFGADSSGYSLHRELNGERIDYFVPGTCACADTASQD